MTKFEDNANPRIVTSSYRKKINTENDSCINDCSLINFNYEYIIFFIKSFGISLFKFKLIINAMKNVLLELIIIILNV